MDANPYCYAYQLRKPKLIPHRDARHKICETNKMIKREKIHKLIKKFHLIYEVSLEGPFVAYVENHNQGGGEKDRQMQDYGQWEYDDSKAEHEASSYENKWKEDSKLLLLNVTFILSIHWVQFNSL